MNPKIIFSDMDHTLLNENLEITDKNKKIIHKLTKKGIPFVICTGRGIYGVERYLKELNIETGFVICQNGGTVYQLPEGKLVTLRSFSVQDILPGLQAAKKRNLDIQLYFDRVLMAEKMTDRIQKYCQTMGTEITILEDVFQYQGPLTKCLLNGPRPLLEEVKQEIESKLKNKVNLYFSNAEFLEFTALEATKGNSMLALASQLGWKPNQILAVGDSENDISMLQKAGIGIAVSNAALPVKEQADVVIPKSSEEDAVAYVIEKYFFTNVCE